MPDYNYSDLSYITTKDDGGIQFNVNSDFTIYSGKFKNLPSHIPYEEIELSDNGINVADKMKEMKLFSKDGPGDDDVIQHTDGSCYFLGVLRSIASMSPDTIKELVTQELDEENKPTGYAIVHFYAMKDGKKVPYDVKVPMTHCPTDEYFYLSDSYNNNREDKKDVRWTTVIQKAYFVSMLWKTNGQLPDKDYFEKNMGSGKDAVYDDCENDRNAFLEGSDPNLFIDSILPERETNQISPSRTRNQMLNAKNLKDAVEMLSDRLMKAKEHKDIVVITSAQHVISVNDIYEDNGKVYISVFDQLVKKGWAYDIEGLLNGTYRHGNVPFNSINITNIDNQHNWKSHQTIALNTFANDFNKKTEILTDEQRDSMLFKYIYDLFKLGAYYENNNYEHHHKIYTNFNNIIIKSANIKWNGYIESINAIHEELKTRLKNIININNEYTKPEFKKLLDEHADEIFDNVSAYYLKKIPDIKYSHFECSNEIMDYISNLSKERKNSKEEHKINKENTQNNTGDNPDVSEDFTPVNTLVIKPKRNVLKQNNTIHNKNAEGKEFIVNTEPVNSIYADYLKNIYKQVSALNKTNKSIRFSELAQVLKNHKGELDTNTLTVSQLSNIFTECNNLQFDYIQELGDNVDLSKNQVEQLAVMSKINMLSKVFTLSKNKTVMPHKEYNDNPISGYILAHKHLLQRTKNFINGTYKNAKEGLEQSIQFLKDPDAMDGFVKDMISKPYCARMLKADITYEGIKGLGKNNSGDDALKACINMPDEKADKVFMECKKFIKDKILPKPEANADNNLPTI